MAEAKKTTKSTKQEIEFLRIPTIYPIEVRVYIGYNVNDVNENYVDLNKRKIEHDHDCDENIATVNTLLDKHSHSYCIVANLNN